MHAAPFAIANECERRGARFYTDSGNRDPLEYGQITPSQIGRELCVSRCDIASMDDTISRSQDMMSGFRSRGARGMESAMVIIPNYATVGSCARIIRYGFNFAAGSRSRAWTRSPLAAVARRSPLAARCRIPLQGLDPLAARCRSLAARRLRHARSPDSAAGRSLPGPAPGLGPARRSLPSLAARRSPLAAGSRCRSLAAGSRSRAWTRSPLAADRSPLAARRSLPDPAAGCCDCSGHADGSDVGRRIRCDCSGHADSAGCKGQIREKLTVAF